MINTADLEKKLIDVETELSSLAKTRHVLQETLKNAKETNIREIVSEWNISEDDCIVMFTKTSEEFYSVITFNSLAIHDDKMLIECVNGCYTYTDDELSYRISNNSIHYSTLVDYSKRYSIYLMDKVQFATIQSQLCDLKINTTNHKDIELTVTTFTDKKIS